MLLSIGIDSLDTGRALPGSHLIQPIELGKDLIRIYPGSTQLAWHLVGAAELLLQPVCEGLLLGGPG